jgi:FkbM family methyltransferase
MYNPDWLRYCKRVVRAGLGTDHLLRPQLTLATKQVGSSYGGWVTATGALRRVPTPIVLSFGLGDDISFDEEIARSYGAFVYGFDPTPTSLNWIATQRIPSNMQIYPIGIANFDGQQQFLLPENDNRGNCSVKAAIGAPVTCEVLRYNSILALLKLPRVDILKLDIEGSEYDVIPDVLSSSILPVQLLIEFHHRLHGIHIRDTRKTVQMIQDAGFAIFSVSPGGREMSFIKTR